MLSLPPKRVLAKTFSIVAQCPFKKDLGVAVATAVPSVGARVPHIKAHVGAVATQAWTNVFHGLEGLRLLEAGLTPKEALVQTLAKDGERERRQVIAVNVKGEAAAFTGSEVIEWKGHLVGKGYAIAGNMLRGARVLGAMREAFGASSGEDLAEGLMRALEAGQAAGGDKRGKCSAALVVRRYRPEERLSDLTLRVDYSEEPIVELRRLLETFKARKEG